MSELVESLYSPASMLSVGDILTFENRRVLLVRSVSGSRVVPISLHVDDTNRWRNPVAVDDVFRITQQEAAALLGSKWRKWCRVGTVTQLTIPGVME